MLKKEGKGFVVRDCNISYKSPAKLDDALDITCKVTEIKGVSLKMEQKLYRGENILCEIVITLVFLSLENMRPSKISSEIISLLQ